MVANSNKFKSVQVQMVGDRRNPKRAVDNREKLSQKKKKKKRAKTAALSTAALPDAQHDSYVAALKRKNLTIHKVAGDGNCLFRAVAHQLYGDVERHKDVRNECMDYMKENLHLFLEFFDDKNPLDTYIAKHRKLGSWGGDHELESMRRCFNLKLEIYIYDATLGASLYKKDINEDEEDEDSATKHLVKLSYIGNNHYDSIVGQAEDDEDDSDDDNYDDVDDELAHIRNLEKAHIRNLEKVHLRPEWLAKDDEYDSDDDNYDDVDDDMDEEVTLVEDYVDEEETLVEDYVDEEEARFRHEDACRCEEGDARFCTFIERVLKYGVPIPDAEGLSNSGSSDVATASTGQPKAGGKKEPKCCCEKYPSRCIVHHGSGICTHGRQKSSCKECGGSSFCGHGKQKSQCRECNPSSFCGHGKQKSQCRECNPSAFCTHGKQKSQCRECNPSAFCTHGKQKSQCKECGGSVFCGHGKRKSDCRECNPSAFCIHDRKKSTCEESPCVGKKRDRSGRDRSIAYLRETGSKQLCYCRDPTKGMIKRQCFKCNFAVALTGCIRSRLKHAWEHEGVKKDKSKTKMAPEYLGCTSKEYREYLADLFEHQPVSATGAVMSFKNHGDWHIDHICPISFFNFEEDNDDDNIFFAAFNFKNTQPLWAADNLSKGNKFDESKHPLRWDKEKREWVQE